MPRSKQPEIWFPDWVNRLPDPLSPSKGALFVNDL